MKTKERLLSEMLTVLGEAVKTKFPEFGLLTDDGSGEVVTQCFTMRSFSWDDADRANFEYGNLRVWWHQTSSRVTMFDGPDFRSEDLIRVLVDCLGSIGY
jgi:hypothetical protein